ncbi:MAG: hypothetical protein ACKOTZ_08775 [Chloroflexota bacterium]
MTLPGASARTTDGRLARLHLRGGMLVLARAELEQMAGAGTLDREALADLAEVRWRTGDLAGAAEPAGAHLAAGGSDPIAHLIGAQALDRSARHADARREAERVHARLGQGLDRVFAGEQRGAAWPAELPGWMDTGATGAGRYGILAGGREVAAPVPGAWALVPPPVLRTTGAPSRPQGPGSVARQLATGRAMGRELARAEDDLAAGDIERAIGRLALVLRFDPALAPVILSLADRAAGRAGPDHPGMPALHLLRGDAYRGTGREVEARAAWEESQRAMEGRAQRKELE